MYKGMTPTEYIRERREAFARRGLCDRCGIRPAQSGRRKCFDCSLAEAARWQRRADRLVEAGLCARCGKRPHRDGVQTCEECAKHEKERSREWRQKHAAE